MRDAGDDEPMHRAPPPSPTRDVPPPARLRVLVVDDDGLVRSVLGRSLAAKFDVTEADSFGDALPHLDAPELCAVISDWQMGEGGDGLALLAEVRRRRCALIRILVSGRAPNEELERALASGIVHAFIPKPWPTGELVHALERALARARAGAEDHELPTLIRSSVPVPRSRRSRRRHRPARHRGQGG